MHRLDARGHRQGMSGSAQAERFCWRPGAARGHDSRSHGDK